MGGSPYFDLRTIEKGGGISPFVLRTIEKKGRYLPFCPEDNRKKGRYLPFCRDDNTKGGGTPYLSTGGEFFNADEFFGLAVLKSIGIHLNIIKIERKKFQKISTHVMEKSFSSKKYFLRKKNFIRKKIS